MARENLTDAVTAVQWLTENDSDAYNKLCKKIGLSSEEPDLWQDIADNIYLPYDETRAVYLPDDGFLLRKPWEKLKIPPEKRHLLYENYHPLFIWRQRMAKQADTLLAMFLHRDRFSRYELERNYDFYQGFTLHHSSLSTCIFGIVASLIGHDNEAYRYFNESARMDLDDHHNNVHAGIHAANMAGTWQALVFGFAGLRADTGSLKLSPKLPEPWNAYRFRIVYRGSLLEILTEKNGCEVLLLDGKALDVILYGKNYHLEKGENICASMK